MYKHWFAILFFFSICISTFSQNAGSASALQPLNSISGFKLHLGYISNLSSSEREKAVNALWEQLVSQHRIPLIIGDSVLFLFRGTAAKVSWAGDFNGWNPGDSTSNGRLAGNTGIWIIEKTFSSNARLDYKIVTDKDWINDPANPYIQYSGYGPNSELRMPNWKYPDYTIARPDITHGQLSKNII